MNVSRRRVLFALAGIAGILVAIRFLGNREATVFGLPPRPSPNAPDPHFPNGMNRPQPTTADGRAVTLANQKELREDVSRRYGTVSELKEQVEKTEANSMPSAWALEESPKRKTGSAGQGSGQRLIDHLLCFHGKLRECKICGKEKFFHLFLIDFPLQAKESCVSLKRSKRRGTFQGITERGT